MGAGPDPWGELSSRYHRDEDAQFLIFVEQYAEARGLITTGETSKLRMALVAVDNLGEVLLHRQKQRIFRLAEEGVRERVPRLSRKDLRRFERDFGMRVSVARRAPEDELYRHFLSPLLDDVDDAVFRAGHAYRNRVYHADHHNPAVLPLITQAYFAAVGRAFVRLQPTQVARSMSDARLERFATFGFSGSQDEHWPGMFAPAEAAEAITAHLTRDFEPALSDAQDELVADLTWRTQWGEGMIKELLEEGITAERLELSLRWGEFWDVAGIDDEVVRLTTEMADAWGGLIDDSGQREAGFARFDELNSARNTRIQQLRREFVPKFDPRDLTRIRRLGTRLRSAKNLGDLFIRYQRLDDRLQQVEHVLDEAAIGWDRYVQAEVDRARGK